MKNEFENKAEGDRAPNFIAWHVPQTKNAPWTRIGAAWSHKDGQGMTLQLDFNPRRPGRIVLRTPKAEKDKR